MSVGFVCGFINWWSYFPKVPIEQLDFIPVSAVRHLIVGFLLLIVATIDYFTFYNYPMQKCIILAKTERSKSENHKIFELAATTTSKDRLFSEFFKGENRSKMGFSVSFMTVLNMREMKIILIGGALKHAADYYMFALCGVTS